MAVRDIGASDVTVDALWNDPCPIYARLRRDAPVCFVPALELWFVTRRADVEFGASHPNLFPASVVRSPLDRTLGGTNVLTVEGDAHRAFRGPLGGRCVRGCSRSERRAICDELLDTIVDPGGADLMAEYFEPVSTRSLARVIGHGDIDAPTLIRWFHGLATGTSNYERDPEKQNTCEEGVDDG